MLLQPGYVIKFDKRIPGGGDPPDFRTILLLGTRPWPPPPRRPPKVPKRLAVKVAVGMSSSRSLSNLWIHC